MKYFITILFVLIVGFAKSQISIGYSIGVFGDNLNINSFSNPLAITSKSCIQITNGISKFLISGHGLYLNACAVKENEIKLNIVAAPNPAVDYTIIKFGSKIKNNERFDLQIYNANGQLLKKVATTQLQLLDGFRIETANFSQGIYFIKIFSSSVDEVIKIIKN